MPLQQNSAEEPLQLGVTPPMGACPAVKTTPTPDTASYDPQTKNERLTRNPVRALNAFAAVCRPLPFRTVAAAAIVPLLYALLMTPAVATSVFWRFFNYKYVNLIFLFPLVAAFSLGAKQKTTRQAAWQGAFWGLALLFVLTLGNTIKLYQLAESGSYVYIPLEEILNQLSVFMGVGAALGAGGSLLRYGVEKGKARYKKRSRRALGRETALAASGVVTDGQ